MSKAALYSADSRLAELDSKISDPECKGLLETAREQVQLGITNRTCADVQTGLSAALEGLGMRLGRDADIASKEAIAFLTLFRREIIAVRGRG